MVESLVNTLLQWPTRRPRLVIAAAALLAGVAIAALPHLQVETDVLHLLPRNGPATQAFTRYLHQFGSLDWVYVMFQSPDERPISDFAAPISAYVERVRQLRCPHGIITGVALTIVLAPGVPRVRLTSTLNKLRPDTAANAMEAVIAARFGVTQDVHLVIATGPRLEPLLEDQHRFAERLRAEAPAVVLQSPTALLPSAAVQDARARRVERAGLEVQRAREDLASATTAAGFRAGAFAPFDERLPRVLQPRQRLTYDGFQQSGLEDVLAPLVRATPGGYAAVAYAFPTTPAQAEGVERAVRAVGGTLVLTGTPVVNRELETRFWPQFRLAAAVGGIAVVTLIVIGFRSVRAMLLAILPTGLGLVWALGVISFAGVELDLFSVFGLLTFLGIGVDYGIHVVHRWRTLHDPVAVVVRLGPALLLAGGTTLAGFGTLCFSAYPPLRSLGIVLFTTVAGALVASLTALPVLLKGQRP